jgi:small conductance mechanosensitive channel
MEDLEMIAVQYAINIVSAVAIVVIGRWVARQATSLFRKVMERRGVDPMLTAFVGNVAYTALLAFVLIAALGKLGVQTASFVAVVGAAGLAIALAFQGSLSNLAAGVLLVTFRPFNIGDFIEAAGVSGVVEEIAIFTTTITTGDNKTVIVPNAAVSAGTITNFSAKPTRRVDMVFGVGYGDDLDKVRHIIEDVLAGETRVIQNPAPTVAVAELADSSVNFVVRPWVNSGDYWPVYFALHETLKKRFDAEGVNIPFPQSDVHLHQVA